MKQRLKCNIFHRNHSTASNNDINTNTTFTDMSFLNKKTILIFAGIIISIIITLLLVIFLVPSNSKEDSKYDIKRRSEEIREKINNENMRQTLRIITKKAHVSGTESNLEVANFIKNKLIEQGLQGVHFNEYNVLLSYPNWTQPNRVQILSESGQIVYETSGRSRPIIPSEQNDPTADIQWFAYSADGEVEGDIVYVNEAKKSDFDHLEKLGIDVKGKILLARNSNIFRGNIAKLASSKGASGVLIYSDPVLVAPNRTENSVFKYTEDMPPDSVQRGTVFIGFGDPLTPAVPSIENLYKEKTEETLLKEKSISKIPMIPLPYNEALILFQNMNGKPVEKRFQGGLNVTYRYGPGLKNNQRVRMIVHSKNEERRIQNVIGYIKGEIEPEKYVIVSNHYDAWTYGAVDPNSGTSALLEVSRSLMEYSNKTSWKPGRSILFAHWDAEEYGLIGSTEFAEEYREQLIKRAVAVINMDFIGGNKSLFVMASPSTVGVLREAAKRVDHPLKEERDNGRKTVYDAWKYYRPSKSNRTDYPQYVRPAGGSDHLPFFDYLGIPIITFVTNSLRTPPSYPLYHTIYETPYLVENLIDVKDFSVHKSIAELFIDMAIQFTESPIIPYSIQDLMEEVYYDYLPQLLSEIQHSTTDVNKEYFKIGLEQLMFMNSTAREVLNIAIEHSKIQKSDVSPKIADRENGRLLEFQNCMIVPNGINGNIQTRHVLFTPSTDNWYEGRAIQQLYTIVEKMRQSSDAEDLQRLSKKLAQEISLVHYSFICGRHSLNNEFISI